MFAATTSIFTQPIHRATYLRTRRERRDRREDRERRGLTFSDISLLPSSTSSWCSFLSVPSVLESLSGHARTSSSSNSPLVAVLFGGSAPHRFYTATFVCFVFSFQRGKHDCCGSKIPMEQEVKSTRTIDLFTFSFENNAQRFRRGMLW